MATYVTGEVHSSQEYFFAVDIVFCIDYHFSRDIGLVEPCPKPKTRTTLLTPPLEKLLIKQLFTIRKAFIKAFYDSYKNTLLSINRVEYCLEKNAHNFLSLIDQKIKNCQEHDVYSVLMKNFFQFCIKVACVAVLFHRGGKASGSLNFAVSCIYSVIKEFQELKYFNDDTWQKLTLWGQERERLIPDSSLGLEQVPSGFMSTAYFKIVEPTKPANSVLSSTPGSCSNSLLNKQMTLEAMIRKATQLTSDYSLNKALICSWTTVPNCANSKNDEENFEFASNDSSFPVSDNRSNQHTTETESITGQINRTVLDPVRFINADFVVWENVGRNILHSNGIPEENVKNPKKMIHNDLTW